MCWVSTFFPTVLYVGVVIRDSVLRLDCGQTGVRAGVEPSAAGLRGTHHPPHPGKEPVHPGSRFPTQQVTTEPGCCPKKNRFNCPHPGIAEPRGF